MKNLDKKGKFHVYKGGENMECLKYFEVDGKQIPYYYFIYDKNLHVLLRRKNYWKAIQTKLEDGTYLIEYLMNETWKQFDDSENFYVFDRAFMLIIHYFSDNRIRDVDNFVYKPIIDCIKKTRIIKDDDFKNLALTTVGQPDIKDCIEVYLIPFWYYGDFIQKEFYNLTEPLMRDKHIMTIKEYEQQQQEKQKIIDMRKKEIENFFFQKIQ